MSAGTSSTPAAGNPPSSIPNPNCELFINDPSAPYPPVYADLNSLADILHRTSRTRILEYGVGHSTMVFARHIREMWELALWTEIDGPEWPIGIDTVDAGMPYIGYWAKKLVEEFKEDADHLVNFHHKVPELVNIGNQIASCYPFVPAWAPDFIYIDAPEGYQTKMPDSYVPIAADVIRLEPYLMPNTIIVLDGRAANARFIFRHLKNTWAYRYCEERDQHFFVNVEGTRGLPKHERIVKEIYYAKGEWDIETL